MWLRSASQVLALGEYVIEASHGGAYGGGEPHRTLHYLLEDAGLTVTLGLHVTVTPQQSDTSNPTPARGTRPNTDCYPRSR